ncbi:hypothetical protein C9374_001996 [Naegleria lovaniensis]|uniref:TLC domain-containing protein n=1 Tax=Naegleria lovaniensis TaxID=51637 RepID=A0AA88GW37_NAELO|nr:uncharacterized protein C9374_001996 [Naegleria lovaniensis]KAG2386961.1 hypothetical protein C9374_001996 [Naegleria lovaniensis]
MTSSSYLCGFISEAQSPLERWRSYVQQGLFSNELHFLSYRGYMIPIVMVLSMAFHSLLYYVLSDWFSKKYSSTFRKKIFNSELDRKEWNSRMVSNVHAVIATVLSFYCLFSVYLPTDNYNGILAKSAPICTFLLTYCAGYFLYDLIIVAADYPHLGGMETILHHTTSFVALIGSMLWEKCVVLLVLMLFTEISTPFVNQRYFLSKCNMKSTKLYAYNGILMWASFGIVRISFCFYMPYIILADSLTWCSFPIGWIIGVWIMVISISLLNIIWFYKITSGLIQVLFAKPVTTRNLDDSTPSTSTAKNEDTKEAHTDSEDEADDVSEATSTTLPLVSRR